VYGLENIVDFLSSAVVLWRFFAPGSVSDALEQKLKQREQRASIAISFILVLLGLGVIIAGADDLSRGEEDTGNLRPVIAISFFSILIFGGMTVFKFQYSRKLSSSSLYKDGVCSLLGTILSISLFANALVIRSSPDRWWIDPVIAVCAGIAAAVFGLYGLFVAMARDKLPICSIRWWFTSQGDTKGHPEDGSRPGPEAFGGGTTEMSGVDVEEGEVI